MKASYLTSDSTRHTLLSPARSIKSNETAAIQWCGQSQLNNGQSWLAKDPLLVVVLGGRLRIRYGTFTYTIDEGSMGLIRKNILVTYSTPQPSESQQCTRFLLISLKDELLKEFVKMARLSVLPPEETLAVTIDSVDTRLLNFFDSLQSYSFETGVNAGYLTKIKLLELLFNLAQANSVILPQLLDLRPHFRPDITAIVEENLMSPLSLTQLAMLSGRSLSSFKRDFLSIYNMPPSTWLRRRRLEKARELFLNTSMTVTDVCYTLGFENLAHFSRLFKSHFGYSPSKSKGRAPQLA